MFEEEAEGSWGVMLREACLHTGIESTFTFSKLKRAGNLVQAVMNRGSKLEARN